MGRQEQLEAWREFAGRLTVPHAGQTRSWAKHIDHPAGYSDEQTLVQPYVFPRFAQRFLGFEVGATLAAEQLGEEGKPDFTPSDAVTHPFVFETKSTKDGADYARHLSQIERYLRLGAPRIRKVVVTNVRSIRVYHLDDQGNVAVDPRYSIDLSALANAGPTLAVGLPDAQRWAAFCDAFRFRQLTTDEKLAAVRQQQPWSAFETTNPDWLAARVDSVVRRLTSDVEHHVENDVLQGAAVTRERRAAILDELRGLELRLGGDPDDIASRQLTTYMGASDGTRAALALRQFEAHTAYYTVTRLLVVRIWEDAEVINTSLQDGGFDRMMAALDAVVRRVVDASFSEAKEVYPVLFAGGTNNYSWYTPSDDAYAEALYELSNTYLGDVSTDIFGTVYERMLERIDRKNIGQFYTPRDIIKLIWDLLDLSTAAQEADAAERGVRVFDFATGSGGFLVEAARRLRQRIAQQREAGTSLSIDEAAKRLVDGLVGAELQRFSAYLAEVNLLVQVTQLIRKDAAAIPSLGILWLDSMSLHEPHALSQDAEVDETDEAGPAPERDALNHRVKDVGAHDFEFDFAVGNPPYVGEKAAAATLRRTRELYPYWKEFGGQHLDVLYWFLILGVSKLRQGGRFGFITTEYWLRSGGAQRTREYLAQRCHIERIILFRDMRLFPDAPGQHSMVIVGKRVAEPDHKLSEAFKPDEHKPLISVYEGANLDAEERQHILDVLKSGRRGSGVRTFKASTSPNALGANAWSDVLLTSKEARRRRRLARSAKPVKLNLEEGVIATPVRMTARHIPDMTQTDLAAVGGADARPGIFHLPPTEVAALAPLNDAERSHIRPIINTVDLFPYGALVPRDGESMVYLHRDPDRGSGLSLQQVQHLPFPTGLPALEAHLRRFQTVLQKTVERYSDRRPWWTVHRARTSLLSHDRDPAQHTWADYGLTARWGEGGRLMASLAPAGTVPASGLHGFTAEGRASAAYVVALINSSAMQEMADHINPGVAQQQVFESLPLAWFPEVADEVTKLTLELATHVRDGLIRLTPRWPLLGDTLRSDIGLAAIPDGAWLGSPTPKASRGHVKDVSWIRNIDSQGAQATRIGEVHTEETLFGPAVVATSSAGATLKVVLETEDDKVRESLRAHVEGLASIGKALRDVPTALVPIDDNELVTEHDRSQTQLQEFASTYRDLRGKLDDLLGYT